MEGLTKCLLYDGYIKSIDLSFNNIKEKELTRFTNEKVITDNQTIQNLDLFGNPATMLQASSRVLNKKIAVELLTNITQHLLDNKLSVDKGLKVKREELGQEFLYKRSLYSKDIPR